MAFDLSADRADMRPLGLSLRARLLLLVLFAVTPAMGLLFVSAAREQQAATDEALEKAASLAQLIILDYERLIDDARGLLGVLATVPEVRGDGARCSAFLAQLHKQYPRYVNLGVSDLRGDIHCSALPLPGRVNNADRAYFRRALETRGFTVGDFQFGRITGEASVNFGYPVFDGTGQARAVVFAALDLAWLNRLAGAARLPPGSTVTVIDHEGTVLVRYPDPELWVGKNMHEAAFVRERPAGEKLTTALLPGLDGMLRFYAFAPLHADSTSDPAYVVVGIPREAALAGVEHMLARHLLILGVVAAVVFAIAWISGDVLVLRRTNALVAAARRLAAGDLAARTGLPAGRDEIARVAGAFDEMATTLARRAGESARQHRRIMQLNRVYAMLSAINGAILRIRDREALLNETCRIAVEHGGLRLAWVGMLERDGGALRPVAVAGAGKECVERLAAPLAPAAAAVREGRTQVCNDIERDPHMAPWREEARAAGFAAAAAFPLRIEGRVLGVLNLCAAEAGFFDQEESRLIEEVAADTSLGLEYIEKDRQLHYLAYHDPLTGLPNAALFEDRLKQSVARAHHHSRLLAVLVLDIKDFRRTAQELGRHVGDQLLQEVARYLSGGVREGDTVARLGGDEFGALLADVAQAQDVVRVADKLVREFPRVITVNGEKLFPRVRAGVASYPADGEEPEVLIQRARIALRAPSVEPDNTVSFYAPELDAAAQERRRIAQALHHAIERAELALHYQPVVDIATRRITGAEALVRWQSAELGPISPATFIPVAEETGLIVPLGRWVLEEGCRQAARWREQGYAGLRIAVNVSVKQLYQPDFLDGVNAILEATGVAANPSLLAIEITESELMENIEASVAVLRRLKEYGLSVYVDDFGTGYSSLAYLKHFPADKLKIDISFVRDMLNDRNDYAIVATIIAMARTLELKTVAEGVEEAAQAEALRALGCDEAQGYYFGRPEPAEVFAQKWLGTPAGG